MGAALDWKRFKDNPRTIIQQEFDKAVDQSRYMDGNSYSGRIGMLEGEIVWHDLKLESEADADRHLAETHEKYDPPIAISYLSASHDNAKFWLVGGWCSS